MSTAMERYEQPLALIQSIDDLARLSKQVAESNYYGDTRSAQQAAVKLMIARELGLGLTSISTIHLVEGKITLGYQLMIALVKRSGRYQMKFRQRDDDCVRIEWFERDDDGAWESVGFSKFDMKDAERAGIKRGNYGKYPVRMLTARAVSDGFNAYAPECAGGALYSDGELSDDPTPQPARPIASPRTAPTPAPRPDMDETVVEAEVVVDAPEVAPSAEASDPAEQASTTTVPQTPVQLTKATIASLSDDEREAVYEACDTLGIKRTVGAIVLRFGSDAHSRETLLPALAAAVNPPASIEGEATLADVAAQFEAERDNGTLDAEVEAERKARRMAAAGTFGES